MNIHIHSHKKNMNSCRCTYIQIQYLECMLIVLCHCVRCAVCGILIQTLCGSAPVVCCSACGNIRLFNSAQQCVAVLAALCGCPAVRAAVCSGSAVCIFQTNSKYICFNVHKFGINQII
jgi:hypothetical protein